MNVTRRHTLGPPVSLRLATLGRWSGWINPISWRLAEKWVDKPYLLAISANFDVKRCSAATLRLRVGQAIGREDRKEVYPGVNEGQLGNRITNVATAIGAAVSADRVNRRASCVPIVGVHGHGDDIECSQGRRHP